MITIMRNNYLLLVQGLLVALAATLLASLALPLVERLGTAFSAFTSLIFIPCILCLWHARHAKSATQQSYKMVEQRSQELQALNDIYLQDLDRSKQVMDELARSRAQLRHLVEHQTHIKEEERKRIARELHDDLGQSLSVLRIDLSLIANSDVNRSTRFRIQQALAQIEQTITAMRLIINELRPPVLDLGLDAAIEWESKKFTRRTNIPCTLDLRIDDYCLPDELTTAFYRIAQESLTNIMRHANASLTEIRLWIDEGWLFMRIADDGVGMQENGHSGSKSFGLVGIGERIFALGGAFTTESAPGNGTRMMIAAPLEKCPGSTPGN